MVVYTIGHGARTLEELVQVLASGAVSNARGVRFSGFCPAVANARRELAPRESDRGAAWQAASV